jgi:hypothetical protein
MKKHVIGHDRCHPEPLRNVGQLVDPHLVIG